MGRRPSALLVGLLIGLGVGPGAPARAADPPVVACSVDLPTVAPGGAVVGKAWASAPSRSAVRYAWEAGAGRLESRGREMRWDLAGLPPGTYAAAVRVTDAVGGSSECVVRVIVRRDTGARRPALGPARETGAALLVAGGGEAELYGLYSYLLLGAPPDAGVRERYLRAIDAFWTLIPELAGLEQYVPRAELNVAYMPVTSAPGARPSAEWLLDHYDYARARSLLRHVPGAHRDGPYLVSTLRPLGRSGAPMGQHLFQDLSRVPPHLAASWVKEFLNQAAQERFWDERTGSKLALRLRVTVGILGEGLPEVRKGLDGWITWIR